MARPRGASFIPRRVRHAVHFRLSSRPCMKPLVTIAVPTLERLHYLKEANASALAQSYLNVEEIVGGDGKEEAINAWGSSIAAGEPRVRYQRNGRRLGLAGNW